MSVEVPDDWRVAKLGEVATLSGGTTPSKTNNAYWSEGTVPWATPTDITSLPMGRGRISATEAHVAELALKECSLKLNPPNTVLMTSRATIGYAVINDLPMATNQGFLNFRCSDDLDPEFLCHWLNSNRNLLTAAAGGSTFKELSRGTAKLLPILLPTLDEQQRIAEVLRFADDVLSLSDQKARQAEATLVAYLAEAFAQAVPEEGAGSALEDVLSHIFDYRGVPPPKASAGVPLLTAKNVRAGYLDPEPREFIAEEDYESWMRRGLPTAGDVMFTTEAPLGNVAAFPSYRAALGQRTLTLRPKLDRLAADYLRWLLLSPNGQALIQSHATGSTAKGIKQSTFRKLRFNIPTLDEQAKVGAACEAIWGVVIGARDQISTMRRLRAMLSDDLLSGRVRVPA